MFSRITMIILGVSLLIPGCSYREQRIQKIESQHPQWDRAIVEKVASARIEIGMNQEMIKAALGEPDSVRHEGEKEIWGYAIWIVRGLQPAYKKFVYFVHFEDKKVINTTGNIRELQYLYWTRNR